MPNMMTPNIGLMTQVPIHASDEGTNRLNTATISTITPIHLAIKSHIPFTFHFSIFTFHGKCSGVLFRWYSGDKITTKIAHTQVLGHFLINKMQFYNKLLRTSNNFCTFAQNFNYTGFGTIGHMNKVRITAIRQTVYPDLMAQYENPIEHACDIRQGLQWISIDGKRPEGLCPSSWESMQPFVKSLAQGKGNFFDGWMKNPMSVMISCNDGFRPFSFYIEVIDE